MNDLLGDVKAGAQPYIPSARTQAFQQQAQRDVEMGGVSPPGGSTTADMAKFLGMVDGIKGNLAQFDRMCQDLQNMEDRSKTLVKSREVQEVRNDMKSTLDNMAVLLQRVKKDFERLEQDNEAAMRVPGQARGSATERTRAQLTSGLGATFKKKHEEFKELQERIERDYLQVVKKRIEVVTGAAVSDEQAADIIRAGRAETIIQEAIRNDQTNRARLQNTLAEIQERNAAIHEITQGTEEIVTLLADLAMMVHDQGQKLDSIQKVVQNASDYVETGVVHVNKAAELQRNTRKWKFFCCFVVILAILAAILIVAVWLKPWENIK